MAMGMNVKVGLDLVGPFGDRVEELSSGDGGNRTPVQREDPQDFYILSLAFQLHPCTPDRHGLQALSQLISTQSSFACRHREERQAIPSQIDARSRPGGQSLDRTGYPF
jgi:hypothetical protein